ncbi:hypothetical protein WJX84_005726 [Apatococcus fuscideae]|uniref:Flavin-containing monooxygenase n=1 Tax=Apatococcus fuscideae TaxID=2026836 RepID=A0AAW1TFU9_9CHLO
MASRAWQPNGRRRKAIVVGASWAGLQTASALKKAGLEVAILTENEDVGGVWLENYQGYGLQARNWTHEYPGLPYPAGSGSWPKAPVVQSYLRHFVVQEGLLLSISFGVHVVRIHPENGGLDGWTIVCQSSDQRLRDMACDLCCVCTGLYYEPYLPEWATTGSFSGKILHSKHLTDASIAQGKHVVVVGGNKSAMDASLVCSQVAASTTMVARKLRWQFPQNLLGILPLDWLAYSRVMAALGHPYYASTRAVKALHWALSPVKALVFKAFELLIALQTPLPEHFRPKQPILQSVYNNLGFTDGSFQAAAYNGTIQGHLAGIQSLSGTTVTLTDGKTLEADLVVCATGYKKTFRDFFEPAVQAQLGFEHDGLWLYRQTIPARMPNIAFINLTLSFCPPAFITVQTAWLAALVTGTLKLPSPEDMQADIAKLQACRRLFPAYKEDKSPLTAHMLHVEQIKYFDQIMRDLGRSPWRKGWNLLAEVFAPYSAHDYQNLQPEIAS